MKLQLSPFEKALDQLRKSLDYLNSPMAKKDAALHAQFRGASIQAFEYSYELAIKMIRRQLAQMVSNPQDLAQSTFADLIRTAADAGLLNDVKRLLIYRDARNRTSHTYDETIAEEVVKAIPDFVKDAEFLLKQLQKRNA
jgi:nucleotidyltransferase substrate binding protein (TIGR01987 family)